MWLTEQQDAQQILRMQEWAGSLGLVACTGLDLSPVQRLSGTLRTGHHSRGEGVHAGHILLSSAPGCQACGPACSTAKDEHCLYSSQRCQERWQQTECQGPAVISNATVQLREPVACWQCASATLRLEDLQATAASSAGTAAVSRFVQS